MVIPRCCYVIFAGNARVGRPRGMWVKGVFRDFFSSRDGEEGRRARSRYVRARAPDRFERFSTVRAGPLSRKPWPPSDARVPAVRFLFLFFFLFLFTVQRNRDKQDRGDDDNAFTRMRVCMRTLCLYVYLCIVTRSLRFRTKRARRVAFRAVVKREPRSESFVIPSSRGVLDRRTVMLYDVFLRNGPRTTSRTA